MTLLNFLIRIVKTWSSVKKHLLCFNGEETVFLVRLEIGSFRLVFCLSRSEFSFSVVEFVRSFLSVYITFTFGFTNFHFPFLPSWSFLKFSSQDETLEDIIVKISTSGTELKFHPGMKNLHIISPYICLDVGDIIHTIGYTQNADCDIHLNFWGFLVNCILFHDEKESF